MTHDEITKLEEKKAQRMVAKQASVGIVTGAGGYGEFLKKMQHSVTSALGIPQSMLSCSVCKSVSPCKHTNTAIHIKDKLMFDKIFLPKIGGLGPNKNNDVIDAASVSLAALDFNVKWHGVDYR